MLISLHRTKQSTSACWCKLCPGSRAFFCSPNLHLVYICYPRPRQTKHLQRYHFYAHFAQNPNRRGNKSKFKGLNLQGKKILFLFCRETICIGLKTTLLLLAWRCCSFSLCQFHFPFFFRSLYHDMSHNNPTVEMKKHLLPKKPCTHWPL